MSIKKILKIALLAIPMLIITVIGLNSWTIIDPGEEGVKIWFGEVQDDTLASGFHVVNPLVKIEACSVKDETLQWDDTRIAAQDKLKSSMDFRVTYRAKPSALPDMRKNAGGVEGAIQRYLIPNVESLLRECGKNVEESQDFFKDDVQREMQAFMLDNLRIKLRPYGFEVKDALFSDIRLPNLVQQAIEQTKDREEKVKRERAQLEITALEQQKAVKIAEAREQAAIKDGNALKTMADAKAYKIMKEADAQSTANKKLAASVTPALVDYIRANSWDGKYPTTMLGQNTSTLIGLQ